MKKLLLLVVVFSVSELVLEAKKKTVAKKVVDLVTTAVAKVTNNETKAQKTNDVIKEFEVESVVTEANFDKKLALKKPTVVKFHAPWCSYCVKMAPVFKEVAKKYADKYTFFEVNTDNAKDLTRKYGVRSIPVFKFFDKDGNKVGEISSYLDAVSFEKKMNDLFA